MGRRKSTTSGSNQKKLPNIVSVLLSPKSKDALDAACDERGMTIKSLLGRLVGWFVTCDKTEQAMILGQLEVLDTNSAAELIQRRKTR